MVSVRCNQVFCQVVTDMWSVKFLYEITFKSFYNVFKVVESEETKIKVVHFHLFLKMSAFYACKTDCICQPIFLCPCSFASFVVMSDFFRLCTRELRRCHWQFCAKWKTKYRVAIWKQVSSCERSINLVSFNALNRSQKWVPLAIFLASCFQFPVSLIGHILWGFKLLHVTMIALFLG